MRSWPRRGSVAVSIAACPAGRTVELDREARHGPARPRRHARPRRDRQGAGRRPCRRRAPTRPPACGVLVSFGGDIASPAPPPPGAGGSASPTTIAPAPRRRDSGSRCARGGLATSSTTVRRWQTAGASVHHLIDPAHRPARPASSWRTVSVSAASCLDANIASTAAIVRGESAPAWLVVAGPARAGWSASDGSVASRRGLARRGRDLPVALPRAVRRSAALR